MLLVQRKFKNSFLDLRTSDFEVYRSFEDIPTDDLVEFRCRINFKNSDIAEEDLVDSLLASDISEVKVDIDSELLSFYLPVIKASKLEIGGKVSFSTYFLLNGNWCPIKEAKGYLIDLLSSTGFVSRESLENPKEVLVIF